MNGAPPYRRAARGPLRTFDPAFVDVATDVPTAGNRKRYRTAGRTRGPLEPSLDEAELGPAALGALLVSEGVGPERFEPEQSQTAVDTPQILQHTCGR